MRFDASQPPPLHTRTSKDRVPETRRPSARIRVAHAHGACEEGRVRAYFLGESEKTALRVLVFDKIYRKPPDLDKFLCAHAGPCQRWALMRNVEVFYFPTTQDTPRVRATVTALRKGS